MGKVSNVPRVEVLPIALAATTDPHNVNKHTQRGSGLLSNSLRKRGAFRSIASAGKGVKVPVVMAGNLTLEVAADAGFTEVVNVHVTGNQLVNVVRDDLEPNSAAAIALGIEDNEIGKQSYNPDIDILAAVMADPAMQALREEDQMLALLVAGMSPQFIDYEKEWEGMPEYKQDDIKTFRSIIIHFDKQEDVDKFDKLLELKLTSKTRWSWYPKKEYESYGVVHVQP